MYQSLILPVGSSDIDGPDFILVPWSEEKAAHFTKLSQTARELAEDNENFTCIRYRSPEAAGFFMPEEDDEWFAKLEKLHIDNTVAWATESADELKERWAKLRVPLPDPPRVSLYSDGSAFLSGPVAISSLRWETSCGINVCDTGKITPAYKMR
ncbi:hypothetical protein [Sulfuriroseicoccus oceanibius]|uniref:Uncharacterized protein n=1 Tax=Sulfuriroseicoccus oceanibius TaxID=2707525 RepID=A0A6B3L432_9BACT|nr:hypothetical protein [Sulfuriroseicoccus oceanibius]QQL44546.1 hypothetical protein G3M56_011740 [Sulfuriroseicoccus oceanibius]